MSETAHTPGPWVYRKIGDEWVVSNPLGGCFDLFRKTEQAAIASRDSANAVWRENKIKNAAQDMLTACKDCLEGRGDWVAAMTAAIAKAEDR